jgi:CubicO group peptidase (beta-lactamase class C family)
MKVTFFYIILISFLFFNQCEKDPMGIKPFTFNWPISTPEQQGFNTQILDSAFIQAKNEGFVDGLLVLRNGYLVVEKYFNGYDKFTPHNVMSVSKSFLSAMVGLALHEGFIDSLDEKVLDYFPEYIYAGIDPRKYVITIEHLLTMRMGIASESANNYSVYQSIYNSANWIKTTIEYPLIDDPGATIHYNTFQTHLLSTIVTKATQQSTWDFATEYLLTPMKIDVDDWEQDSQGYYFGGNSMFFTPREMAVLGYLYLHNGNLESKQIVPESWVELTLSPSTNFTHPNQYGAFKNYNYAYLWWLGQIGGYNIFMGLGYAGQFVIVFPDLNLIVVSTANNQVYPDSADSQEMAIFDIIDKYIAAAINN